MDTIQDMDQQQTYRGGRRGEGVQYRTPMKRMKNGIFRNKISVKPTASALNTICRAAGWCASCWKGRKYAQDVVLLPEAHRWKLGFHHPFDRPEVIPAIPHLRCGSNLLEGLERMYYLRFRIFEPALQTPNGSLQAHRIT